MNLEKPTTCEDCLSFLISNNSLSIEDKGILTSINRQLLKKIALTDRQYALLKGKLLNYKRVWQHNNIAIDDAIDIDQSETANDEVDTADDNWYEE